MDDCAIYSHYQILSLEKFKNYKTVGFLYYFYIKKCITLKNTFWEKENFNRNIIGFAIYYFSTLRNRPEGLILSEQYIIIHLSFLIKKQ